MADATFLKDADQRPGSPVARVGFRVTIPDSGNSVTATLPSPYTLGNVGNINGVGYLLVVAPDLDTDTTFDIKIRDIDAKDLLQGYGAGESDNGDVWIADITFMFAQVKDIKIDCTTAQTGAKNFDVYFVLTGGNVS